MKKIFKYPVGIGHTFTISLPPKAEVVHLEVQGVDPMMWIMFDPSFTERVTRTFQVIGTGHDLPDDWEYVKTFQQQPFVWHLFEGPRA